MAVLDDDPHGHRRDRHSPSPKKPPHQPSDAKLFGLCPFWQSGHHHAQTTTSSGQSDRRLMETPKTKPKTMSFVARSLLPPRRRLRLDPSNCLYFPYEPGKQVKSAIKLKNTSRSHVAFKFQTTAPKSCYMSPPGGILAPGETLIATVFRFVEHPESNFKYPDQNGKVKFKIMSLKVNEDIDYVPELFEEQKDEVVVEQILRVVFLDAEQPTPALEKLKRQLAEAEAALEERRKPPVAVGPCIVGEGLVIDEWKERREKYLAKQQIEAMECL